MKKEKFYVVWTGGTPGIYTSWTDCQLQTKGYEGAKYKSFETREEAEKAFASSPYDYIKRNISADGRRPKLSQNTDALYPAAVLENSLAVHAAEIPEQWNIGECTLPAASRFFTSAPCTAPITSESFLPLFTAWPC